MSSRPRLLDLFCGAGGAAMGYHRAGFDVVGVDIEPQPHYPFEFIRADAMDFVAICTEYGTLDFAAIHASPPCQAYSDLRFIAATGHPALIGPVRDLLEATRLPSVIENVEGAPLWNYITLCGTSFGLSCDSGELWRHRRFEAIGFDWSLFVPQCAHRQRARVLGVYGGGAECRVRDGRPVKRRGFHASVGEAREVMGIDWMTGAELSQAIPPAYTEFIGAQLVRELARA
jgi:DNA (cytosine-5)-methyltransferase 1